MDRHYQPSHAVWPEDVVEVSAIDMGLHSRDVCCICLQEITVQIYKGTGVCCELCRKDRDNDHQPFQPVGLRIHEGEQK